MAVIDRDRIIKYACGQWEEVTGWEPERILGKPFYWVISPDDRFRSARRIDKRFERILRDDLTRTADTVKIHVKAGSNQDVPYEAHITTIQLRSKPYILAVARTPPLYIYQDGKTFAQFYKEWIEYLVPAFDNLENHKLIYRFQFHDPKCSLVVDTFTGNANVRLEDTTSKADITFHSSAFHAVQYWKDELALMEAINEGILHLTGDRIDQFRVVHEITDYARGEVFLKWLADYGYSEDSEVISSRTGAE